MGILGLKFLQHVRNRCTNRCTKNNGTLFCFGDTYLQKPERGVQTLPARRRLRIKHLKQYIELICPLSSVALYFKCLRENLFCWQTQSINMNIKGIVERYSYSSPAASPGPAPVLVQRRADGLHSHCPQRGISLAVVGMSSPVPDTHIESNLFMRLIDSPNRTSSSLTACSALRMTIEAS